MYYTLILVFCLIHLFIEAQTNPQEKKSDGTQEYDPITLHSAIEQGLYLNYGEQKRSLEREILRIQLEDNKESFWMPQLSTSLSVTDQKIIRLKKGSLIGHHPMDDATDVFSFGIGNYTLFNWGKDYLKFLNDQSVLNRNLEILEEDRRGLRHQVIEKYFELVMTNEQEKSRRAQLKHASFIYRLNRERATLKKINAQEYYEARAEFFKSQDLYHKAVIEHKRVNSELVGLLGDAPDTDYYIRESLSFKKIQFSLAEIFSMAKAGNSHIITAKVNEENTKRRLQLERKSNLPLPKIDLNLGAYHYNFSSNENSRRYLTRPTSSDVDIVARINATWNLTGEGGFFNRRHISQERIGLALAGKQLEHVTHRVQVEAKKIFFGIKTYEKNMEILESRLVNAEKYFDAVLENYLANKTLFVNFLHALREKAEAEINLSRNKWLHLKEKVKLVSILGREDFPGENFNDLAQSL